MYTYLVLNILVFVSPLPFVFIFRRKIKPIHSQGILLSIIVSAIPMIIWDYLFTINNIWGFNEKYLIGIYFFKLPLEEILFFITIPFSCLMIYLFWNALIGKSISLEITKIIFSIFSIILMIIALFNIEKIYTFSVFIGASIFLLINIYVLKSKFIQKFLILYIISLIPLIIVNGILTNGIKKIDSGPVVWYNNNENLNIKIIGIPIEDFVFSLIMLQLLIYNFERLKHEDK
jgi:lycopene cyclase domain-containing protein